MVAIAPPFSASVSPARARRRGRRVSASEGIEVSTPTSLPCVSLRRGGDGRTRMPRGYRALPERHDAGWLSD
jgi:hypothetical protein